MRDLHRASRGRVPVMVAPGKFKAICRCLCVGPFLTDCLCLQATEMSSPAAQTTSAAVRATIRRGLRCRARRPIRRALALRC